MHKKSKEMLSSIHWRTQYETAYGKTGAHAKSHTNSMLLCQSIRQVPLLRFFFFILSFLRVRSSHICRLIWSFCFFSIGRHYYLIYFVFSVLSSLRAVSSERRHTHTLALKCPIYFCSTRMGRLCMSVCVSVTASACTNAFQATLARIDIAVDNYMRIAYSVNFICRCVSLYCHHCHVNIPLRLHCVCISIMFKLMVQILMWHTHFSARIISMSVLWIKANLPVSCDLHCAYFSL